VLPSIAGVRVLVVDDDPHIVEGLNLLLRQAGAIVSTARSAATAYRIVEQGQIDVLLSDIGMAAEDGYSLMARIRALPTATTLPAIAITGHVSDEDRSRAFAAGFDRHLLKPIDVPALVALIAQLLAQPASL